MQRDPVFPGGHYRQNPADLMGIEQLLIEKSFQVLGICYTAFKKVLMCL